MDSSDFYNTAVIALEAIEKSAPIETATFTMDESIAIRHDAVEDLRGFIRAADEERERNNTRSNYRAHLKEGEVS
jgi:hypothetical protein